VTFAIANRSLATIFIRTFANVAKHIVGKVGKGGNGGNNREAGGIEVKARWGEGGRPMRGRPQRAREGDQ
jgi:hypothetical protein